MVPTVHNGIGAELIAAGIGFRYHTLSDVHCQKARKKQHPFYKLEFKVKLIALKEEGKKNIKGQERRFPP